MANKRIDVNEKLRLITECRQSGLSDYQWCQENGISPSTFYHWIKLLRERCGTDFPENTMALRRNSSREQDVVRVEILPDESPVSIVSGNALQIEGSKPTPFLSDFPASMEIALEIGVIRIKNGTDPQLLSQAIRSLGSLL